MCVYLVCKLRKFLPVVKNPVKINNILFYSRPRKSILMFLDYMNVYSIRKSEW